MKAYFAKFEKNELFFLILIILIGIILRFFDLELRPIHHDESLHGVYGLYYYTDKTTGFYKYNPLLHGPFLYNTIPWFYHFFGVSLNSLRLMAAITGTLVALFPLIFSKYLESQKTLLILCFTLLSPTLIFWSRFAREDYYIIFFTLLFLFFYLTPQNKKFKNFILPILFILPFCVKENAYLFLVLLIVYVIAEFVTSKLLLKKTLTKNSSLSLSLKENKNYLYLALGIVTASLIYCYYYSGGFVYSEGILDGLYRKSLSYWFHQHSIERISGPFSYQFLMMSWYEPLFFLMLIFHIIHFYTKASRWASLSVLLPTFLGFIFSFFVPENSFSHWEVFKLFKLKIPLDIAVCIFIILQSLVAFYTHLKNNERLLAFLSYIFWSQAFTYSYIGEKVPWLLSYPLIAGFLYLAFYYDFRKKIWPAIIPIAMLNTYLAVRTNFFNLDEKTELIMQVQTSREFDGWAKKIVQEEQEQNIKVLSIGETTWPLYWYFFKRKGFVYHNSYNHADEFKYILGTPPTNDSRFKKIDETHQKAMISFRGWWVPDYNKITFKNYFNYMFIRKRWNDGADMKVPLYIKK